MRLQIHSALQSVRVSAARLSSRFLRNEITAPVFLIGCGRSGKSTLGAALALHPDVAFLDESRHLWIACFPQADLWSAQARARGGRLHLGAQDADPAAARRLRVLFQRAKGRRRILLQSLAANNFRIDFLRTIFPDARFIHVLRNGLDVATEIAQRAERGGWYGKDGYKWRQLETYAARNAATAELPDLCDDFFQRGLLEWRLGLEALSAAQLPTNSLLEIRFEELLAQPQNQLRRCAAFMELGADPAWEAHAASLIHKPVPPHTHSPDDAERRIAGAFLS